MLTISITITQSKVYDADSCSSLGENGLRRGNLEHHVRIDPRTTLLDCLRETLHLTGSKKGCDHDQCGACTVHINGRRINSCLTFAAIHQNDEITTIEGIGQPGHLHPMQAAFVQHDGYQCGYCHSVCQNMLRNLIQFRPASGIWAGLEETILGRVPSSSRLWIRASRFNRHSRSMPFGLPGGRSCVQRQRLGWPTGLEPATTGTTIRGSTIELRPPYQCSTLAKTMADAGHQR